jgi:hypothetical protein
MAAAQNIRNNERKQSRFLPPAAFCVRGHLVFASYRIVAVMYFSCAKIVHLCDATKHFAYFLHFAVRRKRPNRDILCLRSEGVFNFQLSMNQRLNVQCSMFNVQNSPISSKETAFWKKITNILEDFNNWLSGK